MKIEELLKSHRQEILKSPESMVHTIIKEKVLAEARPL